MLRLPGAALATLAPAPSPLTLVNSALPSAHMSTLSATPCAAPQASITNASFTDRHTTRSTPLAASAPALSTKPGRWLLLQVGVKAPGTANSTTWGQQGQEGQQGRGT